MFFCILHKHNLNCLSLYRLVRPTQPQTIQLLQSCIKSKYGHEALAVVAGEMRKVGVVAILLSLGSHLVTALPAQTEITDEELHAIHNVSDVPKE